MFTTLARRFTKDERGERKKKAHEAADRGRESRNEKGEDAGVKNVSRARWRTNGEREREPNAGKFRREVPTATFLICFLWRENAFYIYYLRIFFGFS